MLLKSSPPQQNVMTEAWTADLLGFVQQSTTELTCHLLAEVLNYNVFKTHGYLNALQYQICANTLSKCTSKLINTNTLSFWGCTCALYLYIISLDIQNLLLSRIPSRRLDVISFWKYNKQESFWLPWILEKEVLWLHVLEFQLSLEYSYWLLVPDNYY